ncbi:MAG: hypothetical protein IRY99_11415 [Isosphaeraceae bacterium]|nr:hypothetical protein [Isosphaeraceae bacterium]
MTARGRGPFPTGVLLALVLGWGLGLAGGARTFAPTAGAPYPPSPAIRGLDWAPAETIRRTAQGSDNWPMTWADWKFTVGFGCPTVLNFGRNYAGARDDYVYVFSHDSDSAYRAADRLVLARVPRGRVRERGAYEFLRR